MSGQLFFFVRIHHTINIRLRILILNEKRPISFSSANGSFGDAHWLIPDFIPQKSQITNFEKLFDEVFIIEILLEK